ncbi:uncharacterized protein FTJAE_2818 [Fusarium tjaetaba]|uniref:Halomucin n=1 Tax=Fusarium tjaetaba TaxID=1567544 RepID=A0A8H5W468_9HYPO|nr:uncharacterized protein FTJAE_2818 [Fusarium tjaetaba]KAF5644299.1 hypothetical protein FTJAE_2818 [Fusarium tjaetaba]
MSDGSSSGSDVEFIDLTENDDSHPDIDGHHDDAPEQEEISLGLTPHGETISHILYRPGDPMDVDDEETNSDDGQQTPETEGSLFLSDDDDDGEISNGNIDGGGHRGPPSPPSPDDPGSESDGSEDTDNHHGNDGDDEDDDDDDDVDNQSQANHDNQGAPTGGSPGGGDSGDDSSDDEADPNDQDVDNDPMNRDDEEGNVEHGHKNPDADLPQVLEEESIEWPEWNGDCLDTCHPLWDRVAREFAVYRNRFLKKREELRECKRGNKKRVTDRNREIRGLEELVNIMKEAVREFYAANEVNIQQNIRLVSENEELRRLVPPVELVDFPDPIQLNNEDMEASLPVEKLERLPPDVQRYFRLWRGAPAKARKTERLWPSAYTYWITHGRHRDYENWGQIHKLACQEENMPSVFGKSTPLRTHPYLTLCAPPPQEEERVITGEGEVCTPEPYCRRECGQTQEDTGPFNFDILPTQDRQKIITKILRHALIFDGDIIHAISRLDPYFEPASPNRNCNGKISLLHRFHIGRQRVSLTFGTIHPQKLLAPLLYIELLWMGSQKLTYMIDQKGKYVSRRTHDLAYLPEACRLKTVAIHLPESSRQYMRRKHEPPQIVRFLAQKTRNQPNFRRFRALRTLQGVDYLYCLRGVREMTFFDYDESRRQPPKMPVRDWTFVRDINESVRREKSANDEHFSQLRYLAPLLIQPSVELARQLEEIVNPAPQRMGLLSPPPDMYPQLQAALDHTDSSENESDGDASDGDCDEEMGGDTDDDGSDGDDDDGGADAYFNYQHLATGRHSRERDESPADLDELAAGLSDVLSDEQSDSDSEQEQKKEVWSDNGQTIDLMSDNEDDDGSQYGRDRSISLFVRSPPREHRPEFTTKVETPSPPRATPPVLADQAEITPAREISADSSLFVSPTPYEALNPQAGDRQSPIDLTGPMEMPLSSSAPSSRPSSSPSSSSSSCSSGFKREWSFISVDDDDENDGDDEDEGFRVLGSVPKRPRRPDGDGDDEGAEMMDLEEESLEEQPQEEFVMA